MLSFRIFADDTNVFASEHDLRSLEQLINTELKKVKLWCDANKLSINFSKTNFMIVRSPRKKDLAGNMKIESEDGTSSLLEGKDRVKYLQSPTKVLARLPTFPVSVKAIYQFAHSPQFNVVYRNEVVIARFQHCRGREGIPYSSDGISYCFQSSLSTHVPVIPSRRAKDFCRGL